MLDRGGLCLRRARGKAFGLSGNDDFPRAFGGLKAKALSATDPIAVSVMYDEALRPVTHKADSAANSGEIQKASYTYAKDGVLSTLDNQADAKFDQVNTYDFAGRLKANDVGTSGVAYPFNYLGSARIADELNGGLSFHVTDPTSGSPRETLATGATPPGDEDETKRGVSLA